MTNYDDLRAELLRAPEIRAEYDALEPIYAIKRQLLTMRLENNMTQEELAERLGMKQSALARLESGKSIPSLKTIQRIAQGLGKKLVLTFEPISGSDLPVGV